MVRIIIIIIKYIYTIQRFTSQRESRSGKITYKTKWYLEYNINNIYYIVVRIEY